MTKRRGLADLWVTGTPASFDDGKGPVEVWLQKPNSNDTEKARRRADAARARTLVLRNSPDSDDYLAAVADAFQTVDREELVDVLLQPEDRRVRQLRAAEIASQEEWSEDSYLQGLQDSWVEELAETYAADPADPEASKVFAELNRYQGVVDDRVAEDLADHRAELDGVAVEELQSRVAEELLKQAAGWAWLQEYRATQLWLALRDPADHSKRYFSAVHEVGEKLQDNTRQRLQELFEELMVDPQEGKDSEETPSSSTSSEPLDEVETEGSSGLVAVGQ